MLGVKWWNKGEEKASSEDVEAVKFLKKNGGVTKNYQITLYKNWDLNLVFVIKLVITD